MANKKENFKAISPPMTVEVVQNTTGKSQLLSFTNRFRKNFEALWPGSGRVAFDMDTGQGYNEVALWHIPAEGLRALRGDPEHIPPGPRVTARGRQSTYRKVGGENQLAIKFDGTTYAAPAPVVQVAPTVAPVVTGIAPPRRRASSVVPTVTSPADPPADVRAFRAAAHQHFQDYQPPPPQEDE